MLTEPRQIRIFALAFIAIVCLLAGLWFFVLRTQYVPVYENIRESDASQIVAELDNAGIDYRLSNGGHDILVPDGEAADARVAVAGADIAMGGTTGFELFNENELGLTDFAQKINLQRAIQGELARTIMMMDGVEFARVHLALPERTLFRTDQEVPTAAVTVEMRASSQLTPARVFGITHLVASSVPGLLKENVVVLDEAGGLVSEGASTRSAAAQEIQSEREALEQLVRIRAKAAITEALPQQPFGLEVSVFTRVESEVEAIEQSDQGIDTEPQQPAIGRSILGLDNQALRIMVRTPQPLGPEERSLITDVLVSAIGLSSTGGDVLDFTMGALSPAPPAPITQPRDPQIPAAAAQTAMQSGPSSTFPMWDSAWEIPWAWWLVLACVVLLGLFAVRPRRSLSDAETESFAEMLRDADLQQEPD